MNRMTLGSCHIKTVTRLEQSQGLHTEYIENMATLFNLKSGLILLHCKSKKSITIFVTRQTHYLTTVVILLLLSIASLL